MRVLVVEDDLSTAAGLKFLLMHEKFEVEVAADAASASEKMQEHLYDLILLDVNLPDKSGFAVARRAREISEELPIIFLTAQDDEESIVEGFNLNADDYVVKPFRNRELISRINAALRRRKSNLGTIKCGELVLDENSATIIYGEKAVILSALEYKIMHLLMLNAGRIVTRERLLDEIWDASGNVVNDNTLTVYIKRLREKVGDDIIQTVKGVGYKINATLE